MVEGLGSAVLPQPYQQQAMPTPRRGAASGVGRGGLGEGALPVRARAPSRHSAMPTACERLAGGGGVAVAEGVQQAELQAVDAGGVGEAVDQRSVAIAACGTPKPRKAPETGLWVWMARARARTCGTR